MFVKDSVLMWKKMNLKKKKKFEQNNVCGNSSLFNRT